MDYLEESFDLGGTWNKGACLPPAHRRSRPVRDAPVWWGLPSSTDALAVLQKLQPSVSGLPLPMA
eukprot:2779834-Heterocapsa_arctica.AAC.1